MGTLFSRLMSLTGRVTLLLLVFVAAGMMIIAGLSYSQLDSVTENNAKIRIDRAGRAAAAITAYAFSGTFHVERNEQGTPKAIHVVGEGSDAALKASKNFDALVMEIGHTNQGAANVFRWNEATKAFDRIATTFRKPDGTMPPPAFIAPGHPAYNALLAKNVHVGNVPVAGRLRLAYLMPIMDVTGVLIGSLAVDVGWVDDLIVARDELREKIIGWTSGILLIVASLGALLLYLEMRPLRHMARFAHDVAAGVDDGKVPYLSRNDEIGKLATGLGRVVQLQSNLEHLAYFDQLTGLANRSKFLTDLEKAVELSLAGERACALFMIDLDHFKETNDAFGHAAGDALLVQIKDLILSELMPGDQLCRIGGDDFAILSERSADPAVATALAARLIECMAKPFTLMQGEVHASASIGVVLLPRDAKSGHEAHRNADLALRQAKTDGRGRCVFYAEELNDVAQKRLVLGRQLRHAIENNELAVHFQPQVRGSDNGLHGLEALARWPHPTRGFIPPFEFIPVAESVGLIGELGHWVMNETCRIARQWLDAGFEFHHVSVNVSPLQLWQPNFLQSVQDVLNAHQLPAQYLCLEVTESLFVNHAEDRVMHVMNGLRDIGICLSLDDFGTGYSSLGYLNKLPLEQLKIDRSFVMDVDQDKRKQSLLRGIVALGKGLGMHIVAEGAERVEEVEFLREIGCEAIQGYYFCKPVAALMVQIEVDRIRKEHPAPVRARVERTAIKAIAS